MDAISWAKQVADMGASEILTSVDMDGTGKGFDRDLISKFNKYTSIPIIVSGGYGEPNHIKGIKKI